MTATREDLFRRLAALSVSSVCDADKALTPLDPAIRLIADHGPVAGPARLAIAPGDHLPVLTALVEAEPGEVLVVTTGEEVRRAVLGELFAAEAARRGVAGIVIDGFCRDVVGLRAAGVTVYARGTTPASGAVRGIEPAPSRVQVGGVEAHRGDLVLGDADGVLIASEDRLSAALEQAERIERAEERVLSALRAGVPIDSLLTYHEHVAALRAGEGGGLAFVTPPELGDGDA